MKLLLIFFLFFDSALQSLLLAQSIPQDFFLDGWLPKTIAIPAFDTVSQTDQPVTVTITIDADSILSKVSKYVYGHNAAAWGGKLEQSAPLVTDIKNLAPQVIRWPGGSMSDDYFWNATNKATCPKDLPPTYGYKDLLYGANKNGWTMSTDSYYSLLAKTNSTGIICVNYAYARIGTGPDPVAAAAKLAADWVRYDNGRTRYWEIGNENFGSWEMGFEIDTKLNKDGQPRTISGDLYGKHCKIFIAEMRKAALEVGNDIKIGVVAIDAQITWDVVQRDWNKGMMPHIAGIADFIIVHNYYTPYQENSTVATVLNSPVKTKDIKQYINNGLKTHANHDPLPIALTEYNIFAEGSKQGVSFVNGMHAALVVGELIKNNYGLGCRWDFVNGWNEGNNHGLFADGEPGIARYSPRAPFFYLYYFQKFFGDKLIYSKVTGSSEVLTYASKFSSGQTGILLVNKGISDQVVSFDLKDFRQGNQYYYYQLTGGTDNGDFSRKVYVNGITSVNDGGGPAAYDTIKPYGSIINGDISISLPKMGTIYLVVDCDTNLFGQSIQFDTITAKTLGDADFEISATATSGLPVRFASLTPGLAKIINGDVHILGAGTCKILAYQEGDSLYTPAQQVTQTFLVAKGNQEISFEPIGDAVFGAPAFPVKVSSGSGLPVDLASSIQTVAKISNGILQILGAGETDITATQKGNINFNAAIPVSQVFSVLKASQIITFPELSSKIIGDTDFLPEATASSGLQCIFTSSEPGVAIIVNNKIQITGEGTSAITAFQEGNNNFNPAEEVTQNLIVTDPTGILLQQSGEDFKLLQGPGDGFLTIHLKPGQSIISVYNSLGSLVYNNTTSASDLAIPIKLLAGNGLCFIRVNSTTKKYCNFR